MALEIERKFLVKGDFKSKAYACSHIEQGYIASVGGRTVRVRIRDNKGFLTIKGPSSLTQLGRYEFEKELSLQEALELMNICLPGRIVKNRYLVKSGKHIIEIDEFEGDNEGLIIAEIELGSDNEPFEIPDFLGKEVTGDRRFYNAYLTCNPYKKWKTEAL